MKPQALACIDTLCERFAALAQCRADILAAADMLICAFRSGHKLLVCGNGGSAADADHIAGELLNKFNRHRPIAQEIADRLEPELVAKLEGSLPAISLVAMSGALSAIANDIDWTASFAQQVLGLGSQGDVLMAISTSGNSANCVAAATVAKAKGLKTIALTGSRSSKLSGLCDSTIRVPETETFKVQELHLPVYHAICSAVEIEMF